MNNWCSICNEDVPAGVELCASCAEWEDYWANLTPAQRRAEIKAMDAYASMCDENGERL